MNDATCMHLEALEAGDLGATTRLASSLRYAELQHMRTDRSRRLRTSFRAPLGSALALDQTECRWLLGAFSQGTRSRIVLFDVQPDAAWTIDRTRSYQLSSRHSSGSWTWPRHQEHRSSERQTLMETTVNPLIDRSGTTATNAADWDTNAFGPSLHRAWDRALCTALAWYPLDNGLFVTAHAQGMVHVFDAATFQPVSTFSFSPPVRGLDWNRGLRQCAAGPAATLASPALSTFRGSTASPYLIAVASAENEHELRLLDLASGATTHALLGSTAAITSVRWFPFHEHWLVSGSMDGSIRVWDIRKGGRFSCLATLDYDYTTSRRTGVEDEGFQRRKRSEYSASSDTKLAQCSREECDACETPGLGYRTWPELVARLDPRPLLASSCARRRSTAAEDGLASEPWSSQTYRRSANTPKRRRKEPLSTLRLQMESLRPIKWRAGRSSERESASDWIYLAKGNHTTSSAATDGCTRSARAHPPSEQGSLTLRFSADGRYLISRADRTVLLWDALTGHRLQRAVVDLTEHFGPEAGPRGRHSAERNAPHGRWGHGDALGRGLTVYRWDSPDLMHYLGDQRMVTGPGTDAAGLCWLALGARVYALRCSPFLAMPLGRQPLATLVGPTRSTVYAVATHPTRLEVYTTGAGGLVQVWSGLSLPKSSGWEPEGGDEGHLIHTPSEINGNTAGFAVSDEWLTDIEFPGD
jgi:WD40 repeat protein